MSGEANASAPVADVAPVEKKDEVMIDAPADDLKEAAAAQTKAAVESGSAPDAAPATAAEGSEAPAEATETAPEKSDDKSDVEMTDADAAPAAKEPTPKVDEASEKAEPEQSADAASADKAKSAANSKRKSISGPDTKGKKLNKKASKARILHVNAQPGEHFFVKLKGFPQWPVIICDEEMLPDSLIKSRPVTAKRQDGTYREDYADDDSKKAADRTFPVMYLHTNEFGWVPNTELIDLDPANVLPEKMDKMRKDLAAAYVLASENHPLEFYKDLLQQYQEELLEKEKAKAAKAAATPKSKKKSSVPPEDEDVDMEDAGDDSETTSKSKKASKRKAEEAAETPARTDSVKKPKIKLTSSATPKTANGASATPKSTTAKPAAEPKAGKTKAKKADEKKGAEKEVSTPKEPELTPAEKHERKEREVLFLRHKLQKGLLTRDQEPKEDEMHLMSEYVKKLEALPDLEVSIIRITKINKVLKAILKLDKIPREEEYRFKDRAQALLDTWNKLLASESAAPASSEGTTANGVNGAGAKEAKTNGVSKESSKSAEPVKKEEETSKEVETKEEKGEEKSKIEKSEEPSEPAEKTEEVKPEAVEASA